jgi:hypothetical protein
MCVCVCVLVSERIRSGCVLYKMNMKHGGEKRVNIPLFLYIFHSQAEGTCAAY